MNDPEVTHCLSMRFPVSLSQEQDWVRQEPDPARHLRLAIETLDGTLIGNCGLDAKDVVSRSASLGISIGEKQCWSQGYGTDAMLTLCGFGFSQMNLHRIELTVYPFNPRAIRCYEKCGFQHEGRLREAMYKHGAYHDLLKMSILSREYRELFPQRWPRV
jgi:RimJ/RimL family protein N-acetyltransferase